MPEGVYCGVDIGTTHIKAVLLAPSTELLSVAKARTPVTSDGFGACHDPEQIRLTVEQLMRSAQNFAAGSPPIVAIGVTSVGEEGVPLASDGSLLYPAIAWHDQRASAAADEWSRNHPGEELFSVTGLHPNPWLTVFKWLWLKEAQPDVWRLCETWLGIADYVMWRWTGQIGMSVGHASRTGLLDLAAFQWHDQWAAEVLAHGVAALPPLRETGKPVGTLRPGLIPDLRTAANVPVVATGHDHVVGGYAAGVTGPGQVLDSMGTAEALMQPVPSGYFTGGRFGSGVDFGAGIAPGTHIAIAGLESGIGISSVRSALDPTDLEARAAEVDAGAEGLTYIPPYATSGTSGKFLGHRPWHEAPHFYRAVIEGWSLAADHLLSALEPADDATEIMCIGGGSTSRLWTKIKASIFGRPIRCITTQEMVAVGAALLAGGQRPRTQAADIVLPVAEWVPVYRELRETFRRLAT